MGESPHFDKLKHLHVACFVFLHSTWCSFLMLIKCECNSGITVLCIKDIRVSINLL